jgi:intein/homing endonuclease
MSILKEKLRARLTARFKGKESKLKRKLRARLLERYSTLNQTLKIGKAKKVKPGKSCMTCSRFSLCSDHRKSHDFRCTNFLLAEAPSLYIPTPAKEYTEQMLEDQAFEEMSESERNFRKQIDSLMRSESGIMPDMRVDDRDIPHAPNFVEWCTSPKFLGLDPKPYAKQFQIGIHVFNDWCPRCSDIDYANDIPVDATYDNILEKVQLLNFGVCPKCHANRLNFFAEDGLLDYTEMAGLAGQRCVTGDTLVITTNGLVPISKLSKGVGFKKYDPLYDSSGSNPHYPVVESGYPVLPEKFYTSDKEKIIKVKTKVGLEIKGTYEHPIKTKNGYTKLSEIQIGEALPIYYGQDVWSQRDSKHINPDVARLIGFWVSEGTGSYHNFQITNFDQSVLDLVENELLKLGPYAKVLRRTKHVCTSTKRLYNKLDNLVDGLWRKSADKIIPNSILTSTKESVCAFLQALFEGDGGVEGSVVSYCSLSKRLVSTLSIMLWNLGIPNTTKQHWSWASNGSSNQVSKRVYTLYISGKKSLKKFQKEVGFFSPRKKKALAKIILDQDNRTLDMPHFYEKFPEQVKVEYIALLELLNEDLAKYYTYGFGTISRLTNYPLSIENAFYERFGENHDYGRLYADNVSLSLQRLKRWDKTIRRSRCWKLLSSNVKSVYENFYNKYTQPNSMWTTVKSVKHLTKKYVTYDFVIPGAHRFMANGLLNHNSGKSFLTGSCMATYQLHRYIKLQNPQRFFGIMPNQPLRGCFAALTYDQAKDTLWKPMYEMLTSGNWFKQYNDLLKDREESLGIPLYKLGDSGVYYRHRQLEFYPVSPNTKTLRGRTGFFSAIDEIGLFDAQRNNLQRTSAVEVHTSLTNSHVTLLGAGRTLRKKGIVDIPNVMMANISSTLSKIDMIQKLYKRSQEPSNKRMYGFYYATWEMNPTQTFEGLVEEKGGESEQFWRDFGSRPPMSESSFISKAKHFKAVIDPAMPNAAKITPILVKSESGKLNTSAQIRWNWSDALTAKLMVIDAGYSQNSFAISVCHIDPNKGDLVYDLIAEIAPYPKAPINFTLLYQDVILPIAEKMGVVMLVSDRWQNIKIQQDIELDSEGQVTFDSLRLKYGHFLVWRDALHNGQFRMPKLEMPPKEILAQTENYPHGFTNKPVAHAIFQALTVVDIPDKTVDKGDGLTDDIFRTMVVAYTYLSEPELASRFSGVVRRLNMRGGGGVVAIGSPTSSSPHAAVATQSNMGSFGGGSSIVSRAGR